jgi:hypothetical protein
MTAIAILKGARDLIATPEAWQKGHSARDAGGAPVRSSSDRACKFCLEGAIYRAYHFSMGLKYNSLSDALSMVRREIGTEYVFQWNDRPETTHADVLAILDKVIGCS